jgi:hypothetical protein
VVIDDIDGFLYEYRVDPKASVELYSNWWVCHFALKVGSLSLNA